MRIVADANIPYLHDAFGALGEVVTMPSRQLTRDTVKASRSYFLCDRQ